MNNEQIAALIAKFPRHVHPVGNGGVIGHKMWSPVMVSIHVLGANLARLGISQLEEPSSHRGCSINLLTGLDSNQRWAFASTLTVSRLLPTRLPVSTSIEPILVEGAGIEPAHILLKRQVHFQLCYPSETFGKPHR